MVTDNQVRRLHTLIQKEKSLSIAASKAGMDEKTARKYLRSGKLPSEVKPKHNWRTREDPFAAVWEEVSSKLELNPGLEAKTLFDDLQREVSRSLPGWSTQNLATARKTLACYRGTTKRSLLPTGASPGPAMQSDFTHLTKLNVTINGAPFAHLLYHFVLTYSNWETGIICFSESFESLSEGLQHAFWELGGVPRAHRTDRLSAAFIKNSTRKCLQIVIALFCDTTA